MVISFTDPVFLSIAILAIMVIVLCALVVWMYMRMRRFLITIDAHHIGDSLTHVSASLKELQHFRDEMEEYLTDVERRLRKSVQSVHTVRFNPFKGTGGGGNQSFATTLVNENGDGVIISSLYSRDHVSIFSKPVSKHTSEYELSTEERESLEHAKKGLE